MATEANGASKLMTLGLSSWPYPFSLAVSGFRPNDSVMDVSDEEDPVPGKFMGGKNGKLLRPLKKPKVAPKAEALRRGSTNGGDEPMSQSDDGAAGAAQSSMSVDDLAGYGEADAQRQSPADGAEHKGQVVSLTQEPVYNTVRCCLSRFGLPPTLQFGHTIHLSQNMAACPQRYSTTTLTLVRNNSATGLYFRIGPGAVAFRVVLNVFNQSGLIHTHHPTRWNVLWAKRVAPQEWAMASEYQKVNHFPGTRGIARKDNLARNISRCRRQFGDAPFSFVPHSYILPQETQAFEADFRRNGGTWILKPSASSCGKGIRLVNEIPVDLGPKAKRYDGKDPLPAATWVMQQYIANPLLIDGYKFDLRVYVLVTSFDPLRVYVFNEGLVRFATEKYVSDPKNISNTYMHLTNYSLNKHSASYVSPAAAAKAAAAAMQAKQSRVDEDGEEQEGDEEETAANVPTASKWTLSSFIQYCQNNGLDWNSIQAQMHDVIIKTFISVEGEVLKEMRSKCQQPQSCFELFGWDLMVDENLKVWLIEVNLMPSLSCTTALDKAVKYALVEDTLTLAGPLPFHRDMLEENEAVPARRHPRMDDITFQDPAQLKAMMARLSDPEQPLLEALTAEQRLLIMEAEDELNRRGHFSRIFPTAKTWGKYGKFFDGPRPNNLVLARWEKEKKKGTVPPEKLFLSPDDRGAARGPPTATARKGWKG
eukprot:EG_transcript_4211